MSIVFKQPGLDQRVQYDSYLRKSLLDHFYDNEATLNSVVSGQAMERGDFLVGPYEAHVRRNPDRIQVLLTRQGNAWGQALKITKGVTLEAGSAVVEIAYLIEGLPPNRPFHFAVEHNFAGLPSGAEDRYFYDGQQTRLGQLGRKLDLVGATAQPGRRISGHRRRPEVFTAHRLMDLSDRDRQPIRGGLRTGASIGVCNATLDRAGRCPGRWSVTMYLHVDTSLAESRLELPTVVAHEEIRAAEWRSEQVAGSGRE